MSKSTFTMNKICIQCNVLFETQKVSTLYCSKQCNRTHYKLKKKLEKIGKVEKETTQKFSKVKTKLCNLV